HSPLPCRRAKRQSGFLEAARTGHRSHAQGRGARGVSETQRHCLAKVCSPPIAIFFLDRWNAWVQVGDLAPMKKLAKTITAKSEGILRSIATGLSNGVLEAITAMSRPPSARPRATEPNETSKPSSTSSPATCSLIHPLEIATSHIFHPSRTGACKDSPATVRWASPAECRAACPAPRSCVSSDHDRRFLPPGSPATS